MSHEFGLEALCTGVTCAGDTILSATPACCLPNPASELCRNISKAKHDSVKAYAHNHTKPLTLATTRIASRNRHAVHCV